MIAKHLVISGRVQGVGYRQWMIDKAHELALSGWVRNRHDGTLEAVVAGDLASVEEMMRACRRGPRLAHVESIVERLVEPPDEPDFVQRPTA